VYKIGVGHNRGYSYTLIENEQAAREFIKLNRDSHMEIYYKEKLICEIHTLLPYRLIDLLDLSGNTYVKSF
jgi:hypothetical protein